MDDQTLVTGSTLLTVTTGYFFFLKNPTIYLYLLPGALQRWSSIQLDRKKHIKSLSNRIK